MQQIDLPQAFIEEMELLWSTYDAPGTSAEFFESLSGPVLSALRVNTSKIATPDLARQLNLDPSRNIAWSTDSLFTNGMNDAALRPQYQAGLYYIQDPSAMLPAVVLNAIPGETVLDLCAAPGGKSFAILNALAGQGILIANERSEKRTRALVRNLELHGAWNSIVTVSDALDLPHKLGCEIADAVLLDAPCSGSGMFRKDKKAIQSWRDYPSKTAIVLQRKLMDAAAELLRDGGRLVYSTCSFSLSENEALVSQFLTEHPEFQLLPINLPACSPGLSGPGLCQNSQYMTRIWPHVSNGEGQFCALLQKSPDSLAHTKRIGGKQQRRQMGGTEIEFSSGKNRIEKQCYAAWQEFREENLSQFSIPPEYVLRVRDNLIFVIPREFAIGRNLYYQKTGLLLGESVGQGEKLSFKPSHALALSLRSVQSDYHLELSQNSPDLMRYLAGETLEAGDSVGSGHYFTVSCEGHVLGWAKKQDCMFKNLFPKAWIS